MRWWPTNRKWKRRVIGLFVAAHISISPLRTIAEDDDESTRVAPTRQASFFQPQPLIAPPVEFAPAVGRPASSLTTASLFDSRELTRSMLPESRQVRADLPSVDLLSGAESRIRLSTDAGNAIGKSPSILGVGTQRRNPVVTDPRVRGGRVGRLAAAGSYWVPARIDLDTMLSKIDSRAVDNLIVIKGPYSSLYGPGFDFVDVQLLSSPRFDDGYQSYASTSLDYKTNGENVFGRQEVWGGAQDFGYRVSYGHRTGNDYETGNDTSIPSSFNSRDWHAAIGYDLSDDRHIEFRYLRLDQTNVELPGQAFDIDYLVTDGFDVTYTLEDQGWCDRAEVDAWYNRTRLEGSAQREGKRRIFPYYDFINFVGYTDVDSTSTGFRASSSWGDVEDSQTTLGVDLRHIEQELNEITSGRIGLALWSDANSPIPDSYSSNPGLFAEQLWRVSDWWSLKAGARLDSVTTDVTASESEIAALGTDDPQSSLADILGSHEFNQNFSLASVYLTSDYLLNDFWTAEGGVGYAERPPNLTELYAAQPFMFLLQNGLNTVTGDPLLSDERKTQLDLGLRYDNGVLRGGVHGFYSWLRDYITFENLQVTPGGLSGEIVQTSLKYVNTDLAVLAGGELFGEYDVTPGITAFATYQHVQGTDKTRHGSFATLRSSPLSPSQQFFGFPRGFFSGVNGAISEPLPGISPPEGRVGLRLHPEEEERPWSVEISARIVAGQDRVAASLLESTTPGFTVWDLRAYYRPMESLTLVGGVENFGDRNYREHLDFRSLDGTQVFQPGANFYFGAEVYY